MWASHKWLKTTLYIITVVALSLSAFLPFNPSEVAADPGYGLIEVHVFGGDESTKLPGATVSVENYATGQALSPVITDPNGVGMLLLEDIATYRIKASKTGYAAEWYDNTYDKSQAAAVSVGTFTSPTVVSMVLQPGGSISGNVKVQWNWGQENRANMPVIAVPADGSAGKFGATTGGDGNYSIKDVPYGQYKVASSGRWATNPDDQRWMEQWYNNKSSFDTANTVTVGATPLANINFVLQEGGEINGQVRDQNWQPISGASVYVDEWASRKRIAEGQTDQYSNFNIRGLPTGDYLVSATAPGRELEYYENVLSPEEARMVHLDAPQGYGVQFTLGPGGSFSGTVFNQDGSATVANAVVVAEDSNSGKSIRKIMAEANGTYTFSGLTQGFYKAKASAPGFVWEYYDGAGGVSAFENAQIVPVVAGQNTANINFKLDPGGTISGTVKDASTQAAVANVRVGVAAVTDGDGVPYLPFGAMTDKDGKYTILGLPFGSYKVFATGKDTSNPRYMTKWYDQKASWETADTVTVDVANPTASNIHFSLEKGGAIKGVLTKTEDGNPIDSWANPWVRVWVYATKPPLQFVANGIMRQDGSYIVEGLPTGDYLVRAGANERATEFYNNAWDFSQATAVRVTAPGDKTGVNFSLEEGGRINGHIWNQQGQRLVNFLAMAEREDGRRFSARTHGIEMDYQYEMWVPFGSYKVAAMGGDNFPVDPWYVTMWYDNTRSKDQARVLEITKDQRYWWVSFSLPRGGAISGQVTRADGVAIQNAWIKVSDYNNWEHLGVAFTDADGHYRLIVEQRDVRVVAGADGFVPEYYSETADPGQAMRLQVMQGQEFEDVSFTLIPGGAISGTTYEEDGTTALPRTAVTAVLVSDPGRQFRTLSGDDGEYKVNVPYGDYKVMAQGTEKGDPRYAREWYDQKTTWEDADTVSVTTDNPNRSGINFSLELGGSILGTVEYEWGGTAWDAWIVARDAETGMLAGEAKISWYNWGAGYTITGLASGDYQVTAWAKNHSRVFYDGKKNWEEADIVTVTAPQERDGINFRLIGADGRISGDITYEGEVPDPETHEVKILAVDIRMTGLGTKEMLGLLYSISGPGYYQMNNVGEGDYIVVAFLDADDDGQVSPGDPYGFYKNPEGGLGIVSITRDEQGQWSRRAGIDIVITDGAKGLIVGAVELERQEDYSGATIYLEAPPDWASEPVATSGPDGRFSLLVAPGTYAIRITKEAYLPARQVVEVPEIFAEPAELGTARLLIGDIVPVDDIDYDDLVTVAGAFGSSPPTDARADINGDGKVNIFDLVLIGKNYGATESSWSKEGRVSNEK